MSIGENGSRARKRGGLRKQTQRPAEETRNTVELYRKHLDAILAAIPLGVIIIEKRGGRITYLNERALQLYGTDPRRLEMGPRLFKPDGSIYPPDELPAIRALLSGETVRNEELVIQRPDGTSIFVAASAAPLFGRNGQVVAAVGILDEITQRKKMLEDLRQALASSKKQHSEITALMEGSRAVLQHRQFKDAARAIFDYCKSLIGARAGYVALLSADGTQNELVFLDPGGLSCSVDTSLPMPIRGLRAQAYHSGNVVYDNDFGRSEGAKYLPPGHVRLDNVLFAPLTIREKIVGVLGLANKPGGFIDNDARIASAFAELAGIALNNSRTLTSLRDSEGRFRNIYEESPIGIAVCDADGRLISANWACLDIFGVTDETEVLGYKLFEDPNMSAGVKEQLAKGKTTRSEIAFDFEKVKQQGLYRTGKSGIAYLATTITPLVTGPEKLVAGYLVQVQDITERRRAELERERMLAHIEEFAHILQRERDTLKAVMENTGAQLAYLDPEFNFMSVNSAYAAGSGYAASELIGRNHFELFPNEENQRIFNQVRDTGRPVEFHDRAFVFPGQAERGVTYWDWTLVPVKDTSGQVRGLVLSLVDTTPRVRAEEQVRSFERLAAIGELSGNISHELRNPLATIDSSIFYLKGKLKDSDEKVLVHLERIKSSVDRSTGIIQSLLNLARLKEPQRASVELRDRVSATIASSQIPDAVRVTKDFPAEAVNLLADSEQLNMVFYNVITNAVQAMEGKGTLTVSIRTSPDLAEIAFTDTGPGIPTENLDQIFRPLFSTKAKGIGLGLSIAKLIIERHGGTMRARSELGKGATIAIRLPMDRGKANEGQTAEAR
jgi:PAS domain S-box-containing protein